MEARTLYNNAPRIIIMATVPGGRNIVKQIIPGGGAATLGCVQDTPVAFTDEMWFCNTRGYK